MTAATLTLTDFLLARLDEDEAAAKAAAEAPWVTLQGVGASQVLVDPTAIRDAKWRYGRLGHVATTSHDADYAGHIARHDPARVLAECEAKRRTIAAAENFAEYADATRENNAYRYELVLRRLLGPMAAIYADHPDYREEWRP